jgi:hypothetical protein
MKLWMSSMFYEEQSTSTFTPLPSLTASTMNNCSHNSAKQILSKFHTQSSSLLSKPSKTQVSMQCRQTGHRRLPPSQHESGGFTPKAAMLGRGTPVHYGLYGLDKSRKGKT